MSLLDSLKSYLPFGQSSEPLEHFFSLNITISEITGSVWVIDKRSVFVLSHVTLPYSAETEIIDVAAQALDEALGPSPLEPTRVLFGVPSSWSAEDNLKENYLKILKAIVKSYGLEPLAFVTTSHAISHFLNKQDGVPLSAVLIGIGPSVEASLIKAGKIVDTRIVSRTDHLFDDIEKALLSFEGDVLPSKVIAYPVKESENIERLKSELTSYPWMGRLSFLHFPKIETQSYQSLNQAVIFAGAYELDPDISLKHSFAPVSMPTPKASSLKKSDLGFVVGDINEQKSDVRSQMSDGEISGSEREDLDHVAGSLSPMRVLDSVNLEKLRLPAAFTNLAFLNRFGGGQNKRLMAIPALFLVLLIGYLFLAKAEVIVFVDPKVIERESQVIVDPKAKALDEATKTLPGKIVETTVTGSDVAVATGQKKIGNAAKGKTVVYNLTSAKVTLPSGTVVTSPEGLKFVLDVGVTVASQSSTVGSDFTTVIKPGKSDAVGVTASAIGPESNLAAGAEMTVASYNKSAVVAKVDEALAGGTSKDVTVVTSDDQKKLQAKLLNDLRVKAQEELQAKLTGDIKIVPEALSVVDGKYTYNKQPNDQASEVSLNASVRFKGVTFSDGDLKTIVAKLVETNVPEGYELNLAGSETSAAIVRIEKDDRLVFNASFKAKLFPKFNTDELKSKVKFKTAEGAINELKKYENIIGAQIVTTPKLPAIIALLPLLNDNISIIVSPK